MSWTSFIRHCPLWSCDVVAWASSCRVRVAGLGVAGFCWIALVLDMGTFWSVGQSSFLGVSFSDDGLASRRGESLVRSVALSRPTRESAESGAASDLTEGAVARAEDGEPEVDFNRDIRPLLSENCFYCHGQDANHREADLRLDVPEDAFERGVIVPGDSASSLMLERIFSEDDSLKMPPPESNRTLSMEEKTLLKRWVESGAKYETHWAFVAPQRPPVPTGESDTWSRNEIDRFIWSKARSSQLRPSQDASRQHLIKRVYADLIGLPPTPSEVAAFVSDEEPLAYERLVDQLLASPHFGERMAIPWLDAARYADSNGFQQDGDTWQWIWRDWVVRAYNQDLPFDQFSIWQLAGDLMPEATVEQKIASGFNRNHLLNGEGGAIAEEQRFVVLFDRMDTTSTNWLGLTMACAQCHDHKYDPISQQDYYALMDAFNRVDEQGVPRYFSARIRVDTPYLELPTEENNRRIAALESELAVAREQVKVVTQAAFVGWRAGFLSHPVPEGDYPWPEAMTSLLLIPDVDRSSEQRQALEPLLRQWFDEQVLPSLKSKIPEFARVDQLQNELQAYRADQIPRVMIMSDAKPRVTHILDRGQYLSPGAEVQFRTPSALLPLPEGYPRNRLGFAQWLFLDDHPLTARVQVNRLWQHFFGRGLVATPEDFGMQSEYPLHRELLDWLAVEFRESGWSTKSLVRRIVTSSTYRQSSWAEPDLLEADPGNQYWCRAPRLRMPAMVLRDWALAAADLLDRKIGGRPVYPYQPDGVWESLAITKERDFTYPTSQGTDLYRRSLYTFWRRTVGPANMFDASNRQACRVTASVTSTPLHALTTLNDPTWVEAARVLASEAIKQYPGDTPQQLDWVYQRILCRRPTPQEAEILQRAVKKQWLEFNDRSESAQSWNAIGQTPVDPALPPVELAALGNVCLAIMNLDEALTRP